jgi:hypothetical protein
MDLKIANRDRAMADCPIGGIERDEFANHPISQFPNRIPHSDNPQSPDNLPIRQSADSPIARAV